MADIKNSSNSTESSITELTLEEDDFGEPKVLTGAAAIGQIILNLFQTPPGTIPDAPDVSLYLNQYVNSVVDSSVLRNIQSTIQAGLSQYLPDFPFFSVQVEISKEENGKPVLIIGVKTAENQYLYAGTQNEDETYSVEEIKVKTAENQ